MVKDLFASGPPTKLDIPIGKLIKQNRENAGMTQEQLAIASGTSQSYIATIESGKANPSIKMLGHIASALNVPLSRLIDY